MNGPRPALVYLLALGTCLSISSTQIGALTIYRIGGESLPEPDPASFGAPADSVRFVQLGWDESRVEPFGRAHLMDVQADSIRPDFVERANLMSEIETRGGLLRARFTGRMAFGGDPAMAAFYDTDSTTAYAGNQQPFVREQSLRIAGSPFCLRPNYCKYIHARLPGAYPLQLIRIYPTPGNEDSHFIPKYTLGIGDGDPLKFGEQDRTFGSTTDGGSESLEASFDIVSERPENEEPLLEFEFDDEPVQDVVLIAPIGDWEIAEFEIVFDGFAVDANYKTAVISLETPGTLGPLSWSGAIHPGASVDMRVRTGDTEDPNIYYRNTFRGAERSRLNTEGLPLTRREYLRLESGEQAGTVDDLDNWSHWSPSLDFTSFEGVIAESLPRLYLQINADFASGGRLDFVQFSASQPPVVTRVLAEIEPNRAPVREVTRFTFVVAADISVGDLGFDSVEIETPALIDRVVSVAVEDSLIDASDWQAAIAPGSFTVQFPRMDDRNTGDVVKIVFDARIYDYGSEFRGRVFDSDRPWEVAQLIEAGDADFLTESNSLSVELSSLGSRTLGELRLSTEVLTPNGDGTNDLLDIDFDLINLSSAIPVSVDVFTLSGSHVAELPVERFGSGPHRVVWNGRDHGDSLLPPGIYVLRLNADTDQDVHRVERIISLAY